MQILLLISIFLLIDLQLSWADKNGKKPNKKAVKKSQPADDTEDWWVSETPKQRLDKLKSYDAFPEYPEYMQQLYKAFELVGSLYNGEDLDLKQMMFDRQSFRSRIEMSAKAIEDVFSKDDDRVLYSAATLHRQFKLRYYLSFIYNTLEQLLNHDTPSLVVYDLVLEVYSLVDLSSYELKLRDLIDKRSNSVYRNRIAGKNGIPHLGEVDKIVGRIQIEIKRIDRQLADNPNIDRRLKRKLERERTSKSVNMKVIQDWVKRTNIQDKLSARSETVVDILTKIDLTNGENIESSLTSTIREMQAALEIAVDNEMSFVFTEDLMEEMESVLTFLRIYRHLIPLVSENREFMEYLKTTRLDRDPVKIRNEAKKTTEYVVNLTFKAKHGQKFESSLDFWVKNHNHNLRVESIHNEIEVWFNKIPELGETAHENSLLSDEEIETRQVALIDSFNLIENDMQSLLKAFPIRDRMPPSSPTVFKKVHKPVILKIENIGFSRENITTAVKALDEHRGLFKVEEPDETEHYDESEEADEKAEIAHSDTYSPYHNEYCLKMGKYRHSSFEFETPEFFKETKVIKGKRTLVPRSNVLLSGKDFEVLCKIAILGADNVRWTSVEHLIKNLGGTIRPTTGSINSVFIATEWSRPTAVHRPHTAKLGVPVSRALSILFNNWGIHIGKFKPLK